MSVSRLCRNKQADGKLEFGVAYFVPPGVSTTFTKQTFGITCRAVTYARTPIRRPRGGC
jgi:hypothetical protein